MKIYNKNHQLLQIFDTVKEFNSHIQQEYKNNNLDWQSGNIYKLKSEDTYRYVIKSNYRLICKDTPVQNCPICKAESKIKNLY